MRWRHTGAVALGAGAVLGAGVGLGYVLQRKTARKWRADEEAMGAAGLIFPGDVEHRYVTTDDGGRIHAVEMGEGPAIVLVHGVTLGVGIWAAQLRSLSSAHRVIAVGQRGHGQSVAGDEGYSFDRMARDLLEVLVALDVRDAVLVGHSMGGMVSMTLAVGYRDQLARHVRGLALVATSAGPVVPGPLGMLAESIAVGGGRGLHFSARRGRGLIPQEDMANWIIRANFGANPDPAALELTRSTITAMSPTAMASLLGPLLTFDLHTRISTIELPTRVVVGTRDLLTPPRWARVMAAQIPNATLTVLEGCGHMVMLERANELDQLLDRFSSELTHINVA